MRKDDVKSLGEALKGTFTEEGSPLHNHIVLQRIMEALPKILRERYTFLSEVGYNEEVLYLYPKSPAAKMYFKQEAEFIKAEVSRELAFMNEKIRIVRVL